MNCVTITRFFLNFVRVKSAQMISTCIRLSYVASALFDTFVDLNKKKKLTFCFEHEQFS